MIVRVACLLFLALTAGAAAAQPQFAGAFAVPGVLCDCDPADFVFRTTQEIRGYAEPDPRGRVVRTVAAGRRIEANDWDDALTVVTTPARAVATRDVTIEQPQRFGEVRYVFWDPDGEPPTQPELRIQRGDEVEVMTWDEGYVYFRHRGVLYGTGGEFGSPALRWLRERNEEEVWFHLTPKPDRPAAWVRIEFPREGRRGNVEILCETHGGCVGE